MDTLRANRARALRVARMVYFMLVRVEDYGDRGRGHYEQQQ